MELKELETKLAEAEGKIKELSEASALKDTTLTEHVKMFTDLQAKAVELEAKITELDQSEKMTEITDKFTALEGRVETVEKTPMPGMTLEGEDGKELGEIVLDPIIRDAEGITRRMF